MNLKTKKIFLTVLSILALVVDLAYAIALLAGFIELEVVGDLAEISKNSQIIILCICALTNFISLFLIKSNLIKHKKKLITLNVIQLLLGNIFNLTAGVINIIILCRKTESIEEIKEKKELPVLEDITKHKWYVYFIIFVFLFILCYTPATNLLPIPDTQNAAIIAIVITYIIQVTLLIVPFLSELKRDFVIFIKNFKTYLSNMLPRFGFVATLYFICNLSLMSFTGNIPTNQAILTSWPLYITAFLAIIIAPLTEELMFRGFMKKFIKYDGLFVVLSSLIFGGLHVITADSLHQLLFIIPYSVLGFAFSLNYIKTKNIASNIFLHSAWNSIGVLAMALVQILQ